MYTAKRRLQKMKTNILYKNLVIVISLLFAIACSEDTLTENESFIPTNPNPEDAQISDNEQWDWVGKFPGEVDNSIQRLTDLEVVINGDYSYSPVLQFAPSQKNLQSSGLYVPPAEQVEVIVPQDVPGLNYQIGIADVFIPSEGNSYNRYEDVTKSGELSQGSNIISSNFGGHLYFYYEEEPMPGDLTLTVNNAVKSLDYIVDQTDTEQWLEDVADSINIPMIWGELVGKNVILTLPIETLKKIERPSNLIDFYDELISQDLEPYGGFTDTEGMHNRLDYPIRLYSDVQLPKNPNASGSQPQGAHYKGGYPMAINTSVEEDLEEVILNPGDLSNPNTKYLMGAFGDTYQTGWTTGDFFGGSASFLPLYRHAHRKRVWPELDVNFQNVPIKFQDDPTLKFIHLSEDERLGMLIQLAQEYGWNMYGYIAQRMREEVTDTTKIDVIKNDLLAIFASEYANTDLSEFFEYWKLPLTSFAGQQISSFAPPSENFWSIFRYEFGNVDETLTGTRLQLDQIPQQDTVYNRSEWVGNSSPIQSGEIEAVAKRGIDGDASTIWHSKWENGTASGGKFPHWVSYEFEEELTFNYFYLQPRQGGNPWNTPRIFKVEVEDETTGEWIAVEANKEFYLRKINDMQYFYLKDDYVARKVRLYMLTPQVNNATGKPEDDDRGQFESVSFAEFGLGLIY